MPHSFYHLNIKRPWKEHLYIHKVDGSKMIYLAADEGVECPEGACPGLDSLAKGSRSILAREENQDRARKRSDKE